MTQSSPVLAALHEAAIAAQKAELAFRESIAAEMARRERERQFAFRRLEIVREMMRALTPAEGEDAAVAAQRAALKRELGWVGESEARRRILEAWLPVAAAIWHASPAAADKGAPPAGTSVQAALATFEAWYEREMGTPFLALMDQEMVEIPVVEF